MTNTTTTVCTWPGCRTQPLEGRDYCRQHQEAKTRAMSALAAGKADASPPYAGAFLGVLSTGFVSRLVITTDPIRRRDELQAGCPYDLTMTDIIAANRNLLHYASWAVDAVMAITAASSAIQRLRAGWYPVPGAALYAEVMDVIGETPEMRRRFMTLPELKRMDLNLLDAHHQRIGDLLMLIGKEVRA